MQLQCVCSNDVGAQLERRACEGQGSIDACMKANFSKVHWDTFADGLCCDASPSTAELGCGSQTTIMTSETAKRVVVSNLRIAFKNYESYARVLVGRSLSDTNNHQSAFVVSSDIRSSDGRRDILNRLSKSFAGVREKAMSASRSGARFFVTHDDAYILKSVVESEYDALSQLANPGAQPFSAWASHLRANPGSLINQIEFAFKQKGTYWLVMRNEFTAVQEALRSAGYTSFYKQ